MKLDNDAIFARLMELKEKDFTSFTLARIGEKWDRLNGIYMKKGICEDFECLRKELKTFINSCGLDPAVITEYRQRNPDVMIDGRMIEHGYNFRYK